MFGRELSEATGTLAAKTAQTLRPEAGIQYQEGEACETDQASEGKASEACAASARPEGHSYVQRASNVGIGPQICGAGGGCPGLPTHRQDV